MSDPKLVAWALRRRSALPRVWLFTDSVRLPDPLPAARTLPRGRAGIVFRHDDAANRVGLGRALARICRERRLTLVLAGDARLAAALGAGVHLRGGRWPNAVRPHGVVTSSAHSVAELRRAGRAGAALTFLSPAFDTRSHRDASGLGPLRWALMARRACVGQAVAGLGGLTGETVKRLPAYCQGAGAIGSLTP